MGSEETGARWGLFARQAGNLADEVASIVDRYRFALLGTIRADGTPRIGPVETHLVHDDLMVVMVPGTRKAADVRRDNRVTFQSPILDPTNPGAEYKLRGRALIVEAEEQRAASAKVVERHSGWRPPPSWLFLAIALTEATYILWRTDGSATMKRWTANEGATSTELKLDWQKGAYRSD